MKIFAAIVALFRRTPEKRMPVILVDREGVAYLPERRVVLMRASARG
jgi:hypothetical protein